MPKMLIKLRGYIKLAGLHGCTIVILSYQGFADKICQQ